MSSFPGPAHCVHLKDPKSISGTLLGCRALNFRYRLYGMNVDSEMELPELVPADFAEADISIVSGSVPTKLDEPVAKGVLYECAPSRFLFRMEGIASFLASDGCHIQVQPEAGAQPEDIRVFLLGSVLGAVLHQRGMLVLNASVVEKDGRALIFAGRSSVGKSTLAAGLSQRGYRVVADEMAVFSFSNGSPLVEPGPPYLKIWHDVLKRLGHPISELQRIRSRVMHRYFLPVATPECPIPVASLSLLNFWNKEELSFEVLEPMVAFGNLLRVTYRGAYYEGLGPSQAYFQAAQKVISQIPMFNLTRPDQKLKFLPEFLDEVEERLR